MKKFIIFYSISGLSLAPIITGAVYMSSYQANYNEYNNVINANYALAKATGLFDNQVDAFVQKGLQGAINEALNWSQEQKNKEIAKNQSQYNFAKNSLNTNRYFVDYYKILAERRYVYPEKQNYTIGLITLFSGMALGLSTLALAVVYNIKYK